MDDGMEGPRTGFGQMRFTASRLMGGDGLGFRKDEQKYTRIIRLVSGTGNGLESPSGEGHCRGDPAGRGNATG